jgi:hypothetical protein
MSRCVLVSIGGVMVSVFAIGPRVLGFKPIRGRWIFKGVKNPQHAFLWRQEKPLVRCRKVLRHFKYSFEVWTNIHRKTKFITTFALLPSDLLLDYCVGMISREISGRIRSSPCRYHSTLVLHAHMSPGEWTICTLMAAVQRRNLTPSTRSSSSSSSLCEDYMTP